MPDVVIRALVSRVQVPPEHQDLLGKSTVLLTRAEKRLYRRSLEPRLGDYRRAVAEAFADLCRAEPSTADTWATSIAFSIMSRGYATVADTMGLMVVGRRRVSEIIKAVGPSRRDD